MPVAQAYQVPGQVAGPASFWAWTQWPRFLADLLGGTRCRTPRGTANSGAKTKRGHLKEKPPILVVIL